MRRRDRSLRRRLVAPLLARVRLLTGMFANRAWPAERRPSASHEKLVPAVISWAAPATTIPRRELRRLGRVARTLAVIVVAGGLSVGACLAAIIPGAHVLATSNRYTPYDLKGRLKQLSQLTTVYDSQGGEIGVLGIEDRQPVKLSEVPKVLVDAVIATEDKTFWKNPGVDLGGVFRALVTNVTEGKIEQGGSTISQQLVKNRVLSASRDLDRKVREIVLAYRLNEQYTKREILEEYLNTVYFGQGAYGVKSAAERFFRVVDPQTGQERGKRLDELNIPEAALLAALIANPEGDNPFAYPERALAARTEVLELQVEQDYLTQAEMDYVKGYALPAVKPPAADFRPQNYWVEEVQRRLLRDERLGATAEERRDTLLRGGLKIHTTRDPVTEARAQAAIDGNLPNKPGFTAALVAIDPKTGFVRGMVGGAGYDQSQYNIATFAPGQQAGSAWKIITLGAALNEGYSPNDIVNGSSPCTLPAGPGFGTNGRVSTRNAEGGGTSTLRRATTGSVNCAFARLLVSVGYEKVIETAYRLGLKQGQVVVAPDGTEYPAHTPVLTLGVVGTTPLEMATVAATIANGGVRLDPTFVEWIEDPDGEIVLDNRGRQGEQAISPEAAACEIDILRDVVEYGTGENAQLTGHVAAGKTGTTDKNADAWFVGMTPQTVAAVWHGVPERDVPGAGFGGQTPARIWKAFMEAQLAGVSPEPWPQPALNCAAPGGRVSDGGRDTSRPVPVPRPAPTAAPPPGETPAPVPAPSLPPSLPPPATSPPPAEPPEG
ncbi:MAG: transglycosylase domain-containing protein [Acidimicrobiia bacterium]